MKTLKSLGKMGDITDQCATLWVISGHSERKQSFFVLVPGYPSESFDSAKMNKPSQVPFYGANDFCFSVYWARRKTGARNRVKHCEFEMTVNLLLWRPNYILLSYNVATVFILLFFSYALACEILIFGSLMCPYFSSLAVDQDLLFSLLVWNKERCANEKSIFAIMSVITFIFDASVRKKEKWVHGSSFHNATQKSAQ